MRALMTRYGAADTADNQNRIRQFGAANPDVLERKAMGLAPGLDDNSDVLGAMLDKLIANTGAVQGRSGAAAVGIPPDAAQGGGMPVAPRPAARAAAPPPQMGPNMPAFPAGNDASRPQPQGGGGGMGGWDWLLAALGLSAARPGQGGSLAVPPRNGVPATGAPLDENMVDDLGPNATRRGGVSDVIDQNERYLPQGQERRMGGGGNYLPDKGVNNERVTQQSPQGRVGETKKLQGGQYQNVEDVGNELDAVRSRNSTMKQAKENTLKAEVDAENQSMRAQEEQGNRKLMDQLKTRKLGEAARRATGRR